MDWGFSDVVVVAVGGGEYFLITQEDTGLAGDIHQQCRPLCHFRLSALWLGVALH